MQDKIQQIKEYIDFIHPNKLKGYTILADEPSKIKKLYKLIREGTKDPHIW